MKKLCFFLLLCLCLQAGAATKFVWLHGIQGHQGTNTWDVYQQYFTPQNGYIYRYLSDKGISSIASGLYTEKIKALESGNQLILVGHSMGGLVARSIQKLSPSVKGIISVGTSQFGATFLQNTIKGNTFGVFENAIKMGNNAINNSTNSFLLATLPVSIVALPLVIPMNIVKNKIVNGSLKVLNNTINLALGVYKSGHACANDLIPGSSYLQNLNQSPINVPLINVYGAEDNWQVVRALGTLSRCDDVKNPANMDKSYDAEYVNEVLSALAFIRQVKSAHDVVYQALAYPAAYLPWIWSTRELIIQAQSQWDEFYNYINDGMHTDLLKNMGAIEYRRTTYCTYSINSPSQKICVTKYVPFQIENDGILSKNDVILPASAGTAIYHVRVPGVNHQEMGNQIEVRKFFDNALKKGLYGKVFVQ